MTAELLKSASRRRLDFLLGGFRGKMPDHEQAEPNRPLSVYAAHVRDKPLGLGGRWLLDDLRKRLSK